MRSRQIFNFVIEDNQQKNAGRGRNEELVELRNRCLVARYFYYGFHKKRSYEETLKILVTNFFITAERIIDIIQQHTEELRQMRESNVSIADLRSEWPHYKW